jgi:hypothetical protein
MERSTLPTNIKEQLPAGRVEDGVLTIEDFRMAGVEGGISQIFSQLAADRRIAKIFLFTPAKNMETIKLLLKEGFKIEGVHPEHYEGLNYISMGKVIRKRGEVIRGPEFSMDEVLDFYSKEA